MRARLIWHLLLIAAACIPATNAKAELTRIRISDDGHHFVQDDKGTPFRPMGFNYDHDADARLIEDYWHTEWDRVENDFRDMKSLGANTVRIHLQFGRFMTSPLKAHPKELERLEKLLMLAEECELYLDITGLGCYHKNDVPVWYDSLAEADRWAAQAEFWKAVAATCRDSNAVFCYDLMNEPVIGGEKPSADWLGPAFAGKHFVQFVARQTNGRERHAAAKQWIDHLVTAVKSVDDHHLITVGLVDWSLNRPGLTSGFDPAKVADNLDFIAVHLYPKTNKVNEAVDTLKAFRIGKPVIVEETFPLSCSMQEMSDFMTRSSEDCNGWISFYWGKMPDEYDAKASIADAITADWLRTFSAIMKAQASTSTAIDESARVVSQFIAHAEQIPDGSKAFTFDHAAYDMPTNDLPIGVFDSGIGGLTVLEAILKLDEFNNDTLKPEPDGQRDFQNERFIYFGDQANMPYGHYSSVNKQIFLKELILKDAAFLLGHRYWPSPSSEKPSFDKPPVKAIVIACNTATAWGLEEIRLIVDHFKIPVFVVGVVEAGARGVNERLSADGKRHTIAVLATVGTCSINAYPKAIQKSVGLAGRTQPVVIQQGSVGMAAAIESDPTFVRSTNGTPQPDPQYAGPAVNHPTARIQADKLNVYQFDEGGLLGNTNDPSTLRLNSTENYVRYDVTTLVESYRESGGTEPIDTVVLGCTHFPLVEHEILTAFERLRTLEIDGQRPYESLISEKPAIVDPARLTARELFVELARRKLRASRLETHNAPSAASQDRFFMSVANPRCTEAQVDNNGGLTRDYKYARLPGQLDTEDTICVPMSLELLPETSVRLIQRRLPYVWQRISNKSTP